MSQQTIRQRIRGDYSPLDRQIGFRVHLKRVVAQISEQQLADILQVQLQTISEYEQGLKPISASMLYHLSKVLRVPFLNFFDSFSDGFDLDKGPHEVNNGFQNYSEEKQDEAFLQEDSVLRLVKAYSSIKDPAARLRMVELMTLLAADEDASFVG